MHKIQSLSSVVSLAILYRSSHQTVERKKSTFLYNFTTENNYDHKIMAH